MSGDLSGDSSLQFDRAEFVDPATAASIACSKCEQPIVQSYYALGGAILCANCREKREQGLAGLGLGRFVRAAFAGLVAAVAGAALWYGVREVTK